MKNLLIALLFVFGFTQAQNNQKDKFSVKYPKGVYYTHQDLMSKKPNKEYKLVADKRSTAAMKRYGGNEYILRALNFDVPEKQLRNRFYAFSTGDELFINGLKHKLQPWYFKILSDGKYFVFRSGIPTNANSDSRQMQIANAKAPVGGRLSGPVLATLRFLYIMDKNTQEIKVIDKRSLPTLLESTPDLLAKYNKETDNNSPDILLKYLLEFNKLD
mgnify:FL=1|jgi:hypothetical protein